MELEMYLGGIVRQNIVPVCPGACIGPHGK
jgi:hypothetical protein